MKIYGMPEEVKLYKCGSPNQWRALEELFILPIDAFTSKKNGRLIKVYIWTDEITEFLVKWSENKPRKE